MEPNIELAKTRDFGEIISDSFLFIKQNLKPLLSCFFVFCGIFLLAGTVTAIMQQIKLTALLNDGEYPRGPIGVWRNFSVETGLATFCSLLTYVAMPITILSFMTLYKEKGNIAPTNAEVWGYFKHFFFKVFFGSILSFIVLCIALVCCVIPGIYFYPILGLIFPIMIVENTTYGYAFNQSFRLIKDHWWQVFGALFITSLIITICATLVNIPFQAVNVWSVFLHQVKIPHLSLLTIIIGTILQQLTHVLHILPMVALGLCYFSLAETKDATGLMGRIDQLGNNAPDTNAPAEEY